MNPNPLMDIAEKVKQQRLQDDLAEIKQGLKLIMENQKTMAHLVEVTSRTGEIVAVNPNYVVAICDGGANEFGIHMGGKIIYHDGSVLETSETREMLTAAINGAPNKVTIG